jgi:cation diffusion facilitator CzcD-associated flavoprotein CzcO
MDRTGSAAPAALRSLTSRRDRASLRIGIVGAGFAGIGLAIRLKKAGFSNITLFERADRLGGTWRDNTYPGAACDVPSHLYSFSFAPKSDWQARFSGQPEILAYIEDIAARFGVTSRIRFGAAVRRATFDEPGGTWTVEDSRDECHVFDVFVTAVGLLSLPSVPKIEGADEFAGARFHSAAWDHSVALAGKRVAVIGSAASAVQIVPELTKVASRVAVFQRTPNWIIPRWSWRYCAAEKALFRWLPFYRLLTRAWTYSFQEALFSALRTGSTLNRLLKSVALWHQRRQVTDPLLREKLTPHYELGCKRVLLSDDYYPCFNQPHVELVVERIERFVPAGIRTVDGRERAFDVVVMATGFDVRSCLRPIEIRGREGLDLQDRWSQAPEAYRGMTVVGFPNLFILYGPNTNLGHNSILYMFECQFGYIVECLERIVTRNLRTLEVSPAAYTRYNRVVQKELARMVWGTGCGNWYGDNGRISANWSGSTFRYWRETRRVEFDHFIEQPLPSGARGDAADSDADGRSAGRPIPARIG